MRLRILTLLLCLVFSHLGLAQLDIYTEEFPPYNYSVNNEPQGMVSEIVKACLEHMQQDIPIKVIPWPRAFRYAQAKRPVMVFSMSRIPGREALFQWLGPIAENDMVFFARTKDNVKLSSLAQAKKLNRIGVARDGSAAAILESEGFNNLVYSSDPKLNMLKLNHKRLDLWLDNKAATLFRMKKFGITSNQIEPVARLKREHLYLAFSPGVSTTTLKRWKDTLEALEKDGTLNNIRNNYSDFLGQDIQHLPLLIPPKLYNTGGPVQNAVGKSD